MAAQQGHDDHPSVLLRNHVEMARLKRAVQTLPLTSQQKLAAMLHTDGQAQEIIDMTEERFLTPEEAARRLSVAPRTIREWLRTGKLRGVKVSGKLLRVPESALEEALKPAAEPQESPVIQRAETDQHTIEDALLTVIRLLLPEGQPRHLRDLGITTFPLAELNAILERHGLTVRVVRGHDPQRLVACTMPGGHTEPYGLFELRPMT